MNGGRRITLDEVFSCYGARECDSRQSPDCRRGVQQRDAGSSASIDVGLTRAGPRALMLSPSSADLVVGDSIRPAFSRNGNVLQGP